MISGTRRIPNISVALCLIALSSRIQVCALSCHSGGTAGCPFSNGKTPRWRAGSGSRGWDDLSKGRRIRRNGRPGWESTSSRDPAAAPRGLASKRDPSGDEASPEEERGGGRGPPGILEFLSERWRGANPLEVRLDATLAACYNLARFLAYDVATGKKAVPGYDVQDVIALANVASSTGVLAICWTAAGVVTGLFEDGGFDPRKVLFTTALAAPVWLATEITCHWPPGGAADAPGAAFTVISGCIGLCATISFGRAFTASRGYW